MSDFNSTPFFTKNGTPYFQSPCVELISMPVFVGDTRSFLTGFQNDFEGYYDDEITVEDADYLCKFAGQLCYLSFGPNGTKNKDTAKYMSHIRESGHGSVLEHANFSVLLYGVSRSFTHELVRHRVGFAYSQVSQRYVNGKLLRFVERPEFQKSSALHEAFERRIDAAASCYDQLAEQLLGTVNTTDLSKTDARKAVNQAARAALPNETEAPILVTANVRSWRHFIEMRCAKPAEPEARIVAFKVLNVLKEQTSTLFADYEVCFDANDYPFVETATRKV